eukprot:754490-Hanusia_phi.AAC.3
MGCGSSKHVVEQRELKTKSFDENTLVSVDIGNVTGVDAKLGISIQGYNQIPATPKGQEKAPIQHKIIQPSSLKVLDKQPSVVNGKQSTLTPKNKPKLSDELQVGWPGKSSLTIPSERKSLKQQVSGQQDAGKVDRSGVFASYGSKCFVGDVADQFLSKFGGSYDMMKDSKWTESPEKCQTGWRNIYEFA